MYEFLNEMEKKNLKILNVLFLLMFRIKFVM